ncbi:hypothetical protein ARAM_000031 [Aspergillus rambellii]|uniref:Uncharacterized protein n=1 Tax=Aspergillus rambellii TaxID=308745 RepID=A0A0F8V5L9_9EURO|nr:hypothetical protein ARAM_000031 [Aspergillus rambellii]
MDFDHLAKELSDRIFQVWIHNLPRNSLEDLAGKLASCHYPADCRKKYIARDTKRTIAVGLSGCIAMTFTLTNVLIDASTLVVTGVVD